MQPRKRGQRLSATRRLVIMAVFAALAYAVMFVFRFNVAFLTFDLKDVVITIAGLLLGPLAALTVSFLVAVLELITVSDTGFYGFLMNFASSTAFSVAVAAVYRYKKRLSGAVLGLVGGVVALVAVMLGLNLLVTPYYMGVTAGQVAGMIPTLFLPFNAVKGMTNAALVLILYKPVSRAMQAAGFLPRSGGSRPKVLASDGIVPETATAETAVSRGDVSATTGKEMLQDADNGGAGETTPPPAHTRPRWVTSLVVTGVGLLLLVAAILVFQVVLGGDFQLFHLKK